MEFNRSKGYETSSPKTFPRQTPEESESDLRNRKACSLNEATGESECSYTYVSNIRVNFSGFNSYNTVYNYDPTTNTYLRSYATGNTHMVYDCPATATSITADCTRPDLPERHRRHARPRVDHVRQLSRSHYDPRSR